MKISIVDEKTGKLSSIDVPDEIVTAAALVEHWMAMHDCNELVGLRRIGMRELDNL